MVDWSGDVMELAKIRFHQIQKLCFNNLSDSDADLPRFVLLNSYVLISVYTKYQIG